jgi:hypothetical protein
MNTLIPLQKIDYFSNCISPHDQMEDKAVALIYAQFVGVRVRAKKRFFFFCQDLYFHALDEIHLGLVLNQVMKDIPISVLCHPR